MPYNTNLAADPLLAIYPVSVCVCLCVCLCVCVYLIAQSCPTLCDPVNVACHAPLSVEFSRREYRVGCHFLLQGIF